MTRLGRRLVQQLSRILEPNEREAVLGDFAESRVTAAAALLNVAGLIARRQIALWAEWRPWLALGGIVVPIAALLLYVSSHTVLSFQLYFWIIENYQHIDPRTLLGTRFTLEHGLAVMLRHACLLSLWSWTGGFVLASLSGRAVWINLALLCGLGGLVFSATLTLGLPAPKATVLLSVSSAFIAFPLIWGVRQGMRRGVLNIRPAVLLGAALITVTAYALWAGGWLQGGARHAAQLSLAIVLSWPTVYIVATAARQLNRAKAAGRR